MSEIEVPEAEVVESKPMDPTARKSGLVDSVSDAKRAYAAATARIKELKAESSQALIEEAKALQALKVARGLLKKEAEGEE
jgi:cellobiose-specific phosphotransferase system component IIA